jgi:alkylation response protein AidB-like acyl-CoA dehydrogenase
MSHLGWTGLAVSTDFGGLGLGWVELGAVLEEMGRANASGPFFAVVNVAAAIERLAPAEQARHLLEGIISGEEVATLALWEDPRALEIGYPRLHATRQSSGDWILDGTKTHVVYGHVADRLLVSAQTDEGLALFDVPAQQAGLTRRRLDALDPTRPLAVVEFDAVVVGEERRVAVDAEQLTEILDRAVSLMAMEQVGGAQKCLEMAVEYAKTRYQFGRPIGSYQAVKHRCAEMLVRVESSKSAAYHAVRVLDDPEERIIAAPMAASLSSENFVWIAGENIQVHGGIGFTWEHDAHVYLKRAKSASLIFGSPGMHRDRLGHAIGI